MDGKTADVANGDEPLISAEGWFGEKEVMWPGQQMRLRVADGGVLLRQRTEFQDLLVFQSTDYGRCLVLDGVIQLTERDECAYQESIAHIPMFAHPCPRRVCIIGGGDGGVLREVCKHACVEHVTHCELDAAVVAAAKRFFGGTVATAFDDPRVTLLHEDGAEVRRV